MHTDHLSAMMAPLKEKYIAGLHEKRPELCDFILHCKNEAVDKEQLGVMHHRAHGLATQAKAFGFERIIAAAHALEELLKAQGALEYTKIAECAESLLRACDETCSGSHVQEHVPE